MNSISLDPLIIIFKFLSLEDVFMFGSISIQFKKIVNNYLIKNKLWITRRTIIDEEDLRIIKINLSDSNQTFNYINVTCEKLLNTCSKGSSRAVKLCLNDRILKITIHNSELKYMKIKENGTTYVPRTHSYIMNERDLKITINMSKLLKLLISDQLIIEDHAFQMFNQDYDYVDYITEKMSRDIVELKKTAKLDY